MQQFVPDIESNIPMPARSVRDTPQLSPHQEVTVRANTIKLLCDLKGEPIVVDEEAQSAAEDLAKQMITDPKLRPQFDQYPNSTMAFLAGMVAQTNCMIVDDLADLKLYVVNKLIYEVENSASAKDRIAALRSLGDIDGVDAFKRRTEHTHIVKPLEEVEKELAHVLDNIEYSVVEEDESEDVELIDNLPGMESEDYGE